MVSNRLSLIKLKRANSRITSLFKSFFYLVPVIFLCNCGGNVILVKPDIPNLNIQEKFPVKAYLLIPDASADISAIKLLPTRCMAIQNISVASQHGDIFSETVKGIFSQVFKEVTIIKTVPVNIEDGIIVETILSEISYKPGGCVVDPLVSYIAKGKARILDSSGGEIWRSIKTTHQIDETVVFREPDYATKLAAIVSSMVNEWAKELRDSPHVRQYVRKFGTQPMAIKDKRHIEIVVKSDVDDLPKAKSKQNKNAYAIVIGIQQYRQKLPRVDFAISDAQAVTEYLTKVLGYPEENVVTLMNERALKSDFEKYFEKWLSNNVENGGTVFIYYSGHGSPNPKTGDAYLVPYDADPSFIDQTGYPLKRMYEALGKLPAKEIIVALDSCFSGAGGRSVLAKGARPLVMNLQSLAVPAGNMKIIAAASGDQISSTYEEKGHGLFTYFMLKGIKNEDVVEQDGSIAVNDLFSYIKPQVERIARKLYNNEQTPQFMGAKKN